MTTTIQFADGDTIQYDGTTDINLYDGIARFIKSQKGKKSFDLFKEDGTKLHRNFNIQLNSTIICIFKPDKCRTCKKTTDTDEDTDECKECMEYKLYSYFNPSGNYWWRECMDTNYTGEECEQIDFRAKIITKEGQYHHTLEWFYCDEDDIKIFRTHYAPNCRFWREFEMTYCKCYDDDDY